jgi:hypothetical protein
MTYEVEFQNVETGDRRTVRVELHTDETIAPADIRLVAYMLALAYCEVGPGFLHDEFRLLPARTRH